MNPHSRNLFQRQRDFAQARLLLSEKMLRLLGRLPRRPEVCVGTNGCPQARNTKLLGIRSQRTLHFSFTHPEAAAHPKAAVHQHKDMFVTAKSFAHGILGITAEDRTYSVSKLFFAYGLNGMYFPFSAGAGTILDPERPKPERTAAFLVAHRPTIFFAVPTFYSALLHAAEQGPSIDFSSVRLAVSAGERLPPEILEKFKVRFGLEILDAIGSTEMLHMFLSPEPGRGRPGSCGFPVPGYEAKIMDDEGAARPTRRNRKLWVKGASAFRNIGIFRN